MADDEVMRLRITSKGWEGIIKCCCYAMDKPAPSDEVFRKMSYTQKLLMGKRLLAEFDRDDAEMMRKAAEMLERLVPNLLDIEFPNA